MKPVPMNYFILVPFIIALLAFCIFFSRAILFTGLRRLKRFTLIMLCAFGALIVLYFIKYISETRLIPTGLIDISYEANNRIVKLIGMAAFVAIAFYKINKEKNNWWLTAVWAVIVALNAAEVTWLAYLYVNYQVPELAADTPAVIREIVAHTTNPQHYIINMIYPCCWILISALCLAKIRKEKRKLVLHTYPSYSKMSSL
ncbi:hypothetical protein [Niastella populi]|nr:hypothetical protein [Niastella populi]